MIIAGFTGANRALHPRQLPQGFGVDSVNQHPGRGDLRPWNEPLAVATVPASPQRKTILTNGRDSASDAIYWLSWTSVVHAIRSLDTNDSTKRIFYSGDGAPKFTDNTALSGVLENPQNSRVLGVAAPISAMTVTINTAGAAVGVEETWYYVHTFVNDLGWESAPSPPSAAVTGYAGTTVDLTSLEAPPGGTYNINRRRIYRTKTGTSGDTDYYFLRELVIGASITQPLDDSRALGELLQTQGIGSLGAWIEPPSGGKFLTHMWGGMAAMIDGKSVRICEPGALYAWPLRYGLSFTDTPVALAVWQQNLLVLTTGRPYLVTGDTPENLSPQPLDIDQSCVSAQSVVSFGSGVIWASPDGLVYFGDGGGRVITQSVMTRDDWQAIAPSTIVADRYEGVYFASYNDGTLKGFMIDPQGGGIFWLSKGYNAMVRDTLSDALYVLDGAAIKKWDAGATKMTCRHKSGIVRDKRYMVYCQVTADAYPVTLKIWRDGSLILTRSVTDADPFTIPDGWGEDWQVEVESQNPVQAVQLVNSVAELR